MNHTPKRCLTCGAAIQGPRATCLRVECQKPQLQTFKLELRLNPRQLLAIGHLLGAKRTGDTTEQHVREWATDQLAEALKEALIELEDRQRSEHALAGVTELHPRKREVG